MRPQPNQLSEQPTAPLPILPEHKGFATLPLAEQSVVAALVVLVVLVLAPVGIDLARITGRSFKQAVSRPASITVGLDRLARFYDLTTFGTNTQLDQVREGLVLAILGVCLGGAYAGQCVHQPRVSHGIALRFGGAGAVRARVALDQLGEEA